MSWKTAFFIAILYKERSLTVCSGLQRYSSSEIGPLLLRLNSFYTKNANHVTFKNTSNHYLYKIHKSIAVFLLALYYYFLNTVTLQIIMF